MMSSTDSQARPDWPSDSRSRWPPVFCIVVFSLSLVWFLLFWAAALVVWAVRCGPHAQETAGILGEFQDAALASTWAVALLGVAASLALLSLKRRISLLLGWLTVGAMGIWAVTAGTSGTMQAYEVLDTVQRRALLVGTGIWILVQLIVMAFYVAALRRHARWLVESEVPDAPPPAWPNGIPFGGLDSHTDQPAATAGPDAHQGAVEENSPNGRE